jgi:hypothetical protein
VHEARPFALVAALLVLVALVGLRERRNAGIRRTRATVLTLRAAMDSHLAERGGECPTGLQSLLTHLGTDTVPPDAWGRPFVFRCPGRNRARYDLSSHGPDGKPGGLDRIE